MKIEAFLVEEWMNLYENYAVYNIAETCVSSISLNELFRLTKKDSNSFIELIMNRRLTYGAIDGSEEYKNGICGRYKTIRPEHVISTHGAAGANHLVMYSLVEQGDKVISVYPTYQQLYSIPESFGAEVQLLKLKRENKYLPDLEELRRLATPETKLIAINNPNNPTGALIPNEMLMEIVEIAKSVDAYLLCDEVYRGLNQEDYYSESVADLYDKGISVSSMSKVFSLAGLRLGWVVTKDESVIKACLSHRDYNMISCGMIDEMIAACALEGAPALLERSIGIVKENLRILDEWVQKDMHYSYEKPHAGTTCLVYYDFDIQSVLFCKRLFEETGVFVTPGDCFGQEKCFRIGYASDNQVLRDALSKLSDFAMNI